VEKEETKNEKIEEKEEERDGKEEPKGRGNGNVQGKRRWGAGADPLPGGHTERRVTRGYNRRVAYFPQLPGVQPERRVT